MATSSGLTFKVKLQHARSSGTKANLVSDTQLKLVSDTQLKLVSDTAMYL